MGKLFQPKVTTTQQPFESNPWETQQPYLESGFDAAQSALNGAMGATNPVTDYTADMNSGQTAAINALTQNGMGVQGQAQGVQSAGANAAAGLNSYTGNQSNIFQQAAQMAGSGALGGFNGTVDALSGQAGNIDTSGLNVYSSNANDLMSRAGQDSTNSIIGNAGKYADNPYLKGQIDAAIGDVNKGFQQDVGRINSAASGSGNINSTRAGVLESRALDDAMDRAGAISSSMRSGAYDTGLGMSLTENQQRMQNQFTANDMVGTGFDRGLAANGQAFGQTADVAGLQMAGANAGSALDATRINQMTNANAGVLAGAGAGMDFLNGGYSLAQSGASDALNASGVTQTQQQNEINGQLQQFAEQTGLPLNLVQQYMATVGGNYGSQGFQSQTTQTASPFQQLAGGITAGLGAFGMV